MPEPPPPIRLRHFNGPQAKFCQRSPQWSNRLNSAKFPTHCYGVPNEQIVSCRLK
jgi:hypothetical protein